MNSLHQNDLPDNPLKALFSFILRPSLTITQYKISLGQKAEILLQFMTVNLVIQLILGSSITWLLSIIDSYSGAISTNELQSFIQSNPYWMLLVIGGILLPFFEEIGFRLPLVFHPISAGISLLYCLVLLSLIFIPADPFSLTPDRILVLGVSFLVAMLAVIVFYVKKPFFQRFWTHHFRWIYYGLSALFGIVHISNFTLSSNWIFILTPIIVLPQLLTGLLIGYIRVQFGFMWGFAFHAIWNTSLFTMVYIVLSFL